MNQILNGVGWLGRTDLEPHERPKSPKQVQDELDQRLAQIERRNRELRDGLKELDRNSRHAVE